MLQKQVFAQRMLENLINDLLDLSQLESSSFSLSQDYFNLTQTVYEAFQILLFTANQEGINMQAEITNVNHLNLI